MIIEAEIIAIQFAILALINAHPDKKKLLKEFEIANGYFVSFSYLLSATEASTETSTRQPSFRPSGWRVPLTAPSSPVTKSFFM